MAISSSCARFDSNLASSAESTPPLRTYSYTAVAAPPDSEAIRMDEPRRAPAVVLEEALADATVAIAAPASSVSDVDDPPAPAVRAAADEEEEEDDDDEMEDEGEEDDDEDDEDDEAAGLRAAIEECECVPRVGVGDVCELASSEEHTLNSWYPVKVINLSGKFATVEHQ